MKELLAEYISGQNIEITMYISKLDVLSVRIYDLDANDVVGGWKYTGANAKEAAKANYDKLVESAKKD